MQQRKVIKGLEYCRQHGRLGGKDCSAIFTYTNNGQNIVKINERRHDCPYGKCKTGCVVTLVDDALDLLKEQEAEQPDIVRCRECRRKGTYDCPIYAGTFGNFVLPDEWYCASGERTEAE